MVGDLAYQFADSLAEISSHTPGRLAEARARAGRRELSSYVTDALRRQLQHDRIGELLAEMEAESGPISEDLMEEARQLWRGPAAPKPRRRNA